MFKKIDIYIIKKFLSTFVLAIALIIVIVIAFDISEKIDDFIERQAPLSAILFEYYLNFVPYFVNLMSPLFTFIAVVFFTSRMAAKTEIVAILTSGINYRRMLRPFIFSAILIAILNFWLSNFLIPPANQKRLAFEEKYIKKIKKNKGTNIHLQLEKETFAYVKSFDLFTNTGHLFTLEKIDYNKGLEKKIIADAIAWDSISESWKLTRCIIREFNDDGSEKLSRIESIDTVLNMHPNDFRNDTYLMDLMNYSQLRAFIKKERIKGSDNISFYEVEQYRRTAFPFSTIILTLIAVALVGRKSKGGTGFHLGIGLSLSFAFIFLMQVSTTFAIKSSLSPFIAVWIPNCIFAIIAVYLLRKAQK